jgi:hypothetical protein
MTWSVKNVPVPSPIHLVIGIEGAPIVEDGHGEAVHAERSHVFLTITGEVTSVSIEGVPVRPEPWRGEDSVRILFSGSQIRKAGPVVMAVAEAARADWAAGAAVAKGIPAYEHPALVMAILTRIGDGEWTMAKLREALAQENVPVTESTMTRALKALGDRGILASRFVQHDRNGKPLVWRLA